MVAGTQVRLANDVAAQFRHLPREAAVEAIAGHLRTFWEARMRAQLIEAVAAADPDVDPLVADAVRAL